MVGVNVDMAGEVQFAWTRALTVSMGPTANLTVHVRTAEHVIPIPEIAGKTTTNIVGIYKHEFCQVVVEYV